jgi:hypothetical protein
MKEGVGQILQVIVTIYKPFGWCLQEIVCMLSQKQIMASQIMNLSFVFSPQKLEELGAVLQGIANAFVCQSSLNGAYLFPR